MGVFGKEKNSRLLPYKSTKWRMLHNFMKPMLESLVTGFYRDFAEIIADKKKNGWQNPEVKLFYEHWQEVIEKDKKIFLSNPEHGNHYDHIEQFYHQFIDVICVVLDEDSHFTLRFYYLLEVMFRDQDKYRIEFHKEKPYWDWPPEKWKSILEGLKSSDDKWKEGTDENRKVPDKDADVQ